MNNNESIVISNKNEKIMQDAEVQYVYEDEIKKNDEKEIKYYQKEFNNKKIQNEINQNSINNSQYNLMKNHLKLICNKIEEGLNNYHKIKDEKDKKENYLQNFFSNIEINKLIKEINYYKKEIENIQYHLENAYNITKINQLESLIKKKKGIYKKIKNENKTLKNVIKDQTKGIDEYLFRFDSINEIEEVSKKIKIERDEMRMNKEMNRAIESKIKSQYNKKELLEKKIQILKENIDYYKKKKINEKDEENFIIKEENEIKKLEENKKILEDENLIELKRYKLEIRNQNSTINELNDEIQSILLNIKGIKQQKKIDELKKKEINRIKLMKRNKSQNILNINNNKIKNLDRIRNLSRDNIRKSNNEIILIKTPTFKNNGEKIIKPFEINKFNKNNIVPKKLCQFIPNNNNYKRKGDIHEVGNEYEINKLNYINNNKVVEEIENLKNEIQYSLKNDIFIDNYSNYKLNIKDEKKNEEKIIEQNTNVVIPYNDFSDIKNNYENLNDQLKKQNNLFKENQQINISNVKRKPFEKIIFK